VLSRDQGANATAKITVGELMLEIGE